METGPDGGTVFARHLRADDGAACAGGAAQVLQLEGAAGQGLAGDGVVFFDYNPIERSIFKHHGFIFAALDIEILCGGLLDGETSRRLQLGHTVPAVPEQVQFELTVGVRVVSTKTVQLTGDGIVAAVPDLELRALDGAASDGIHLVDGQARLLVVLEIQRVIPVGIQCHHLGVCVIQPGSGDRFLGHLINAGQ